MNGRERVLAMLAGKPVDRLPLMPITMMFAADQIGAQYQAYATDFQVLGAAQLAVAEKFDLDYVSCISDPAREAADCGAAVQFFPDQPPGLDEQHARLGNKHDLAGLKIPDPLGPGRMNDRVKAAAFLKERVGADKIVEGWIEGPCAEGADLRGINALMTDFFDDPAFVRDLFEFVLAMELRFAQAQVNAGASLMGIGDAAASLAGPAVYEELIWPYEKRLVDGVHAMGVPVRLHICGNTRRIVDGMGRLACELVDLDLCPITEARARMGVNQVILGNIHPVRVLRDGTADSVRAAIAECHQQAGSRYIVGAGCEVPRGTPEANMMALTDYARSHRA